MMVLISHVCVLYTSYQAIMSWNDVILDNGILVEL